MIHSLPESRRYVRGVSEHLELRGGDAVVLGCMELLLVLDDSNSPLPVLDSTRLLRRAALHRAAEKKANG
jgi:aspartate racemase